VAPMPQVSCLSMLRERASLQPNDPAFTFTDFEQDWAGVTARLTWAQAYRRSLNVAIEVAKHGAVGDRAVILAPQGLEYIVAFVGAMQAGLIAVPLSVPSVDTHDERVSAVFADTTPTVILTTAAVAPSIAEYAAELNSEAAVMWSTTWTWTAATAAAPGSRTRPPPPTCSTPRGRRGSQPA